MCFVSCFWQFDEQKDEVSKEQILRVIFLDPERPNPVSIRIILLMKMILQNPDLFFTGSLSNNLCDG